MSSSFNMSITALRLPFAAITLSPRTFIWPASGAIMEAFVLV